MKGNVGPLGEHNIFTHFPKHPDCDICNRTKITRAHCRSGGHGAPDALPEPQAWADAITADHKVLNEEQQDRHFNRNALVIQDRFTSWLQGFKVKKKSALETMHAFQRFLGPQTKPKHVYTDGSKEFKKAMHDLGFCHDSGPYLTKFWF